MKTSKAWLLPLSGVVALLMCGCVVPGGGAHSDSTWPGPAAAKNLPQFDGIYQNDSVLARRDKTMTPTKLFDFLTGESRTNGNRGTKVEVRASPDANSLRMRLLDAENHEIDSATLLRGPAFELSDGGLILFGPFSKGHSGVSNFGPYATRQRSKLRLASNGDFLGHETDYELTLFCDIIPVAARTGSSLYWPKLAR